MLNKKHIEDDASSSRYMMRRKGGEGGKMRDVKIRGGTEEEEGNLGINAREINRVLFMRRKEKEDEDVGEELDDR